MLSRVYKPTVWPGSNLLGVMPWAVGIKMLKGLIHAIKRNIN